MKKIFGFCGAALLFIGIFTPVVSFPFIGGLNYFQNGRAYAVIIIVLAITSAVLTALNKFKWLWLSGSGAFGLLVFTFISLETELANLAKQLNASLAGTPLKSLAETAMSSVQIQWGWAVLITGSLCLIAAAAIKDNTGVNPATEQ